MTTARAEAAPADAHPAASAARRWLRRTAPALALLAPIAGVELAAYLAVRGSGWLEGWEHLTVRDAELGFSLRPDLHTRFAGVDHFVNRSGVRDVRRDRVVAPRRPDEFLVFTVGDSNAMGNELEYGDTYAARLESALASTSARPVRVVNLGVAGYSSLQSLSRLERWLHLEPDVVVFADSYNDRVPGTPETPETIRARPGDRIWEIGDRIWYSLLATSKLLRPPPSVPPPDLRAPLPATRVPLERQRQLLDELVALASVSSFELVLLATGDEPAIAPLAREGMRALAARDAARAEPLFHELVVRRPTHFLGWYYARRARLERTGQDEAPALVRRYEQSQAGRSYLTRYAAFADSYADAMQQVARRAGIDFVDLGPAFEAEGVEFSDVCHFGARGHARVAAALAERIRVPAAGSGAK